MFHNFIVCLLSFITNFSIDWSLYFYEATKFWIKLQSVLKIAALTAAGEIRHVN